jgi:hypothetical protein
MLTQYRIARLETAAMIHITKGNEMEEIRSIDWVRRQAAEAARRARDGTPGATVNPYPDGTYAHKVWTEVYRESAAAMAQPRRLAA